MMKEALLDLRLTLAIIGIAFASWAAPTGHPAQKHLKSAILAMG